MTVDALGVAGEIARRWAQDRLWLAQHAPESPKPRRRFVAPSTFSAEDVLVTIAPAVYAEALAGIELARGWSCCPFPDHDDSTPSFRAYEDPDDGWYCFGCNRGGTIYDFGSALWGLQTRGASFRELRKRLADELLRGAE